MTESAVLKAKAIKLKTDDSRYAIQHGVHRLLS